MGYQFELCFVLSSSSVMVTLCCNVLVLENRVALVTGSTSGIGLGIARALASRGCGIVLNGFGDEKLINSLKAEFKE